jgi:hypothetical protein
MKKSLSIILLSLVVSISAFSQKFSADQAKADLKFTYDALKAAHPSLYRYTKEEEYNWVFDYIQRGIVDSISKSELAEKVNLLLSTARCVHTSASNAFTVNSKHFFNFNFVVNNGNLYARNIKELRLIRDKDENSLSNSSVNNIITDTSLVKIVSINNIPSVEIISRMMMLKSGDGYSSTFNEAVISRNFNSFFNVLYKVPVICSIEYETKSGNKKIPVERTLKYTAKSIDYTWDNWSVSDSMHSAYLLKNKNYNSVNVLQIKSFKKNYKEFYQRIFARMEKDSVKKIVIDLRANSGGNIYHAFELLNYLIEQDLSMYAERKKNLKLSPFLKAKGYSQLYMSGFMYDVYPSGQRWSEGGMKKYRYSFKSKKNKSYNPEVIVLIDGQSASSASLLAAYLKFLTKAKFIGNETGGTFMGNNGRAFPEILLPNSNIKLKIPLYRITYFPGVPDNGRGVIPDHFIDTRLGKKDQEAIFKRLFLD